MIYKSLKRQENQTRRTRIFNDVQTGFAGSKIPQKPGFFANPGTPVSFPSELTKVHVPIELD